MGRALPSFHNTPAQLFPLLEPDFLNPKTGSALPTPRPGPLDRPARCFPARETRFPRSRNVLGCPCSRSGHVFPSPHPGTAFSTPEISPIPKRSRRTRDGPAAPFHAPRHNSPRSRAGQAFPKPFQHASTAFPAPAMAFPEPKTGLGFPGSESRVGPSRQPGTDLPVPGPGSPRSLKDSALPAHAPGTPCTGSRLSPHPLPALPLPSSPRPAPLPPAA